MKKQILILLAFIAVLSICTAVSAETCTVDSIGCWVKTDAGNQYILFWSEDARAYLEAADAEYADLTLLKDTETSGEVVLMGEQEFKILTD